MTILEARDIIAAAQNQAMFKDQKEELQEILKAVNGIITDLDSTVDKAIKKAKHKKKAVDPSLKFSAEYEISKGFENHLKTLSILVNAQEWTSNLLQKVNIEADRKDEYIQLNVGQTAAFVDGLHDDVCGNISDLVLDGERKQWIATVIGFFIDFVLLIFYAVARWAPAIDETINVDDALAGFISAVASVVTLAITTVVVFSINRYNINKFNKTHTIKYKELVRASSRNEFKKSIMLMSFGEDLKEAKEEHSKIIENTNKLLEFSLSSEKMLKAVNQKADWQLKELASAREKIDAQTGEIAQLREEAKTAQDKLDQHDENARKELRGVENKLEETKVKLEKAELDRTLLESKLDNANEKLRDLGANLNDAQQQNKTMFHEVKEQIADINGARSWSCRVCYSANNIGDSTCSVCGASRTIAKDQIDEVRQQYLPEKLRDGNYLSHKKFVCMPQDYVSGRLQFDDNVRRRRKIILVPQNIKEIDVTKLLDGEEYINWKEITIRKESGETKITGNQYHVNVEGKPDEIK